MGFDLLVGGVRVGTLTTSRGGNGQLRFRSRPHGHDLVLGVDPRGKDVLVRDADGHDVLSGHYPEDTEDAGKVACCDSSTGALVARDEGGHGDHGDGDHDDGDDDDDHEAECRMRTPAECAEHGGRVAGDSCLPDPCGTTIPPADAVRCCVPAEDDDDGEGATCVTLTQPQCMAVGGTMVSALTCDPNPCEPTPPAEPRIRCCEPDDDGMECEHRTATECAARGGVALDAGSCSPDPCGGPSGDDD